MDENDDGVWELYERLAHIACEVLGHKEKRRIYRTWSWIQCARCFDHIDGLRPPKSEIVNMELEEIAPKVKILFDKDDAFYSALNR